MRRVLSWCTLRINFRNENRASLLFIAGSEDNIMPPAVNQSNVKHYRHAESVTDYKRFPDRSYYGVIEHDSWEEVADYALASATEHAALGVLSVAHGLL